MPGHALLRRLGPVAIVGALLLAAACAGAPLSPKAARTSPAKPTATSTASPPAIAIRCTEPAIATDAASAELDQTRRAALELLLKHQPRAAAHALWQVLATRPNDVPAFVLREVAVAELTDMHKNDAAIYASLHPLVVDGAAGGPYALRASAPVPPAATPIQLRLESSGRHERPSSDGSAEESIASDFGAVLVRGEPVTRVFPYDDHRIRLFSDRFLGISFRENDEPILIDLSPWVEGKPDASPVVDRRGIQHARVVGRTLLVSIGPLVTDAAATPTSSYLLAADVDTGKLLWSSEPFAASTPSFVATGPYIVAGFGTAHASGSLVVVEIASGKVVGRLDLPKAPTEVAVEGDKLVVHTEDPNQTSVVTVSPSLAKALGATASSRVAPAASASPAPGSSCVLARAIDRIDRRDGTAAKAELAVLPHDPAADALNAAALFIERSMAHDGDIIDLSASALLTAKPALFDSSTSPSALADTTHTKRRDAKRAPRLVRRKSTSYGSLPRARDQDEVPASEAPSLMAASTVPPAFTVPDTFGTAPLVGSSTSGSETLLTYGNRYIAVLTEHATRAVIDLGRVAPLAGLVSYEVVVHGELLLVSVISGGPAIELGGQKDFIAAYDLRTGARSWKTVPLVSSAGFVVDGDYLIAAHGFGQEKATLNVVRIDTGEVVARTPLKGEPRMLALEGGTLTIPCANQIESYDVLP